MKEPTTIPLTFTHPTHIFWTHGDPTRHTVVIYAVSSKSSDHFNNAVGRVELNRHIFQLMDVEVFLYS